jgi:hypothetical protein
VTRYPVIAEPPLSAGATQARSTDVIVSPVATSPVGALGATAKTSVPTQSSMTGEFGVEPEENASPGAPLVSVLLSVNCWTCTPLR